MANNEIIAGKEYIFQTNDTTYSIFNNTRVHVLRPLRTDEADLNETGPMYKVRFCNGDVNDAFEDELTTKQ